MWILEEHTSTYNNLCILPYISKESFLFKQPFHHHHHHHFNHWCHYWEPCNQTAKTTGSGPDCLGSRPLIRCRVLYKLLYTFYSQLPYLCTWDNNGPCFSGLFWGIRVRMHKMFKPLAPSELWISFLLPRNPPATLHSGGVSDYKACSHI